MAFGLASKVWFIVFVIASSVCAQSPVTITVNSQYRGNLIPKDFVGLSFETASLLKNHAGVKGHLFDSTNAELISLFHILGIRSIRVGGGTVDDRWVDPTREDIDAFFGFVKAAGVKVIYSFRLLNGNAADEAATAKYIWDAYKQYLESFSIGNEPDWPHYHDRDPQISELTPGIPGSAFPSYFVKWKRFAEAIRDSVPGAKFGGPDTGSNYPIPGSKDTYFDGKPWTVVFAGGLKDSGMIKEIYLHNYTGQDAPSNSVDVMVDKMLSSTWDRKYYLELYSESCVPLLKDGLRYRLTESNSFTGGVEGGSNCFATALYALDYLHWWSVHDASGVNFHNKQWLLNDTIFRDSRGNYRVNPMAYGIKAFDVGGYGRICSLKFMNPHQLNLTAYAVRHNDSLFVTIVNKEHGTDARSANVTIIDGTHPGSLRVMRLTAPHDNPFAMKGVALGDSEITGDGVWRGRWIHTARANGGRYSVMVPACSAAVVRIISNTEKP